MTIFDQSDEELLRLCRTSVEAQEILLERYARLVRVYARRFFLLGGDYEDLVQEGMIGLLNAIRQYQPEAGTFPYYAGICIKRRLISAVRAASAKKHAPLNESVSISDSFPDAVPFDAISDNPENVFIDKELYSDVLSRLLLRISPLEKRVLAAYLEGMSYSEIAKNLHRPLKSVGNALQRVKLKAADILSKATTD